MKATRMDSMVSLMFSFSGGGVVVAAAGGGGGVGGGGTSGGIWRARWEEAGGFDWASSITGLHAAVGRGPPHEKDEQYVYLFRSNYTMARGFCGGGGTRSGWCLLGSCW